MSRGGSKSEFFRELDRRTAIGPGVQKLISNPLAYDDSDLVKTEGHPTITPEVEDFAAALLARLRANAWALSIEGTPYGVTEPVLKKTDGRA